MNIEGEPNLLSPRISHGDHDTSPACPWPGYSSGWCRGGGPPIEFWEALEHNEEAALAVWDALYPDNPLHIGDTDRASHSTTEIYPPDRQEMGGK
jgi:hypothetical protein